MIWYPASYSFVSNYPPYWLRNSEWERDLFVVLDVLSSSCVGYVCTCMYKTCECRWVHTVSVSNSFANYPLILSRGTEFIQLCGLTFQILSGKICSAFINGYKSPANSFYFHQQPEYLLKGRENNVFWAHWMLMKVCPLCVCPVAKGACWWLAWRAATAETLIKTSMVFGVTPATRPFPGTTVISNHVSATRECVHTCKSHTVTHGDIQSGKQSVSLKCFVLLKERAIIYLFYRCVCLYCQVDTHTLFAVICLQSHVSVGQRGFTSHHENGDGLVPSIPILTNS